MKRFAGRVAVITGAASGIGRAMAGRVAHEGMKLVLADIDAAGLANAVRELESAGAAVRAVTADVANAGDVERIASEALSAFGAIHLVANNAGVSPLGRVWENASEDWRWALGVNLWGVIHGVRVFTPILLEQDDEGHILNTASVAGLIAPSGMGVYNVTKHAVVALTETLHHDLAARGAKVKCSLLCPAWVPTGIADSERHRPKALRNVDEPASEDRLALETQLRKAVQSGKLSAEQIADAAFEAVRDERFYVLTHPRIRGAIQARMEDILSGADPRDPLGLD